MPRKPPASPKTPRGRPTSPPDTSPYAALSVPRKKLIDEYLKDLNIEQAGRRAGYASTVAYKVMKDPVVQAALKERRALLDGDRALQGARHILNKLWDIETADPREIVEVWKVPCRHCWGDNGEYQFTKAEMRRLVKAYNLGRDDKPVQAMWPAGPAEYAAWMAGRNGVKLDKQGGENYITQREPNPGCSECAGDGIPHQHIHDTRTLSPQAQLLYRGVKFKNGQLSEILIADQEPARDQLAKHYGVAVERKRILIRKLNPEELTDEELIQAVSELEAMANPDGSYDVVEPATPIKRPLVTRPK